MSDSNALDAALRRDRLLVSSILISVITVSWLYLLAGAGTGMDPRNMAALVPAHSGMASMSMPQIGWTPGYTLLMFSMWWLMMIAMMLPSAAPMVLLHASISRRGLKRSPEAAAVETGAPVIGASIAFIAGYLLMWGLFSISAVGAQWGLETAGLLSPSMMTTNTLLGAGLLLAAGVWQLTPLKTVCLRHCRTPIGFLSAHWRPGTAGAFSMGLRHGVYCLGCCWFLMALLFYAGVMNLVWIIGLALYVLIEKVLPAGVFFGRVTGILLIAWGAWLGYSAM